MTLHQAVRNGHLALIEQHAGLLCVWCSTAPARGHLTIEHLVPISRGGQRSHENEAIACRRCNQARDVTPVAAWAGRDFKAATTARLDVLEQLLSAYADFYASAAGEDDRAVREARDQAEQVRQLQRRVLAAKRPAAQAALRQILRSKAMRPRRGKRDARGADWWEGYRSTMRRAVCVFDRADWTAAMDEYADHTLSGVRDMPERREGAEAALRRLRRLRDVKPSAWAA